MEVKRKESTRNFRCSVRQFLLLIFAWNLVEKLLPVCVIFFSSVVKRKIFETASTTRKKVNTHTQTPLLSSTQRFAITGFRRKNFLVIKSCNRVVVAQKWQSKLDEQQWEGGVFFFLSVEPIFSVYFLWKNCSSYTKLYFRFKTTLKRASKRVLGSTFEPSNEDFSHALSQKWARVALAVMIIVVVVVMAVITEQQHKRLFRIFGSAYQDRLDNSENAFKERERDDLNRLPSNELKVVCTVSRADFWPKNLVGCVLMLIKKCDYEESVAFRWRRWWWFSLFLRSRPLLEKDCEMTNRRLSTDLSCVANCRLTVLVIFRMPNKQMAADRSKWWAFKRTAVDVVVVISQAEITVCAHTHTCIQEVVCLVILVNGGVAIMATIFWAFSRSVSVSLCLSTVAMFFLFLFQA